MHLDLATPVLDDQVEALHRGRREYAVLDLDRVAIRGWSFGGYLAALAVLRRPDVFHAAIAGAPVTEWRLYDTHYTERYLGDPNDRPDVYDASSLLAAGRTADAAAAAHPRPRRRQRRRRPHAAAVVGAAGRRPAARGAAAVGVTHMTPQEVVAENLLLHQLDFLRRSRPRMADARD